MGNSGPNSGAIIHCPVRWVTSRAAVTWTGTPCQCCGWQLNLLWTNETSAQNGKTSKKFATTWTLPYFFSWPVCVHLDVLCCGLNFVTVLLARMASEDGIWGLYLLLGKAEASALNGSKWGHWPQIGRRSQFCKPWWLRELWGSKFFQVVLSHLGIPLFPLWIHDLGLSLTRAESFPAILHSWALQLICLYCPFAGECVVMVAQWLPHFTLDRSWI